MAHGLSKMENIEPPASERLESWKEIAVHLKRDVRTVQRWEKTAGLPVHRHASKKVGSVYAYRAELDVWFAGRRPRLEQQEITRTTTRRRWWVAAVAAAVLAVAGALWLRRPVPPPGMVARQVWAGPGVDGSGAPFPDGRYLSFVDWETGDLAVRDLVAGQSRRVTNKGSWAESDEWAEHSVISPDGRQIAYSWANKEHFRELRLIAVGGGQARVLYRSEDVYWMQLAAWSPDGKQILALFSDRATAKRIVQVSVADGSVQLLKALEWRWPEKISLSPDGRYIVYDAPVRQDSTDRDIWLLSTGSAGEEALIRHPADDYAPVWSPDGRKVLFASDRTGATGIWGIDVAEGKARGAPELLKADVGRMLPMGIGGRGSYYYAIDTNMEDIYVAELDPPTGRVVGSPERVSERFLGSNSAPAWSPDGRQLAYLSGRGRSIVRPGSPTLVIRLVDSGAERYFTHGLNMWAPIHWFPDGRSLLVTARDNWGRWSFYRIDAQSGSAVQIRQSPAPGGGYPKPALSPDGKSIFFVRRDSKSPATSLLAYGIQGGTERELYRVVDPVTIGSPVVSRDGRQLAFSATDNEEGLYLMPLAGGETRKLDLTKVHPGAGRLAWTEDGRHLFVVRLLQGNLALHRVPVSGGDPQRIDLANVTFPSVHPDGRRLAYTGGRAGQQEIWVLENFLMPRR